MLEGKDPERILFLIQTHYTILQYFTDSDETQQTDWQSALRLLFLLICFMRWGGELLIHFSPHNFVL